MTGRTGYCILGFAAIVLLGSASTGSGAELLSSPTDTALQTVREAGSGSGGQSSSDLLTRPSGTESKPESLEPLSVRPLVPIEAGRNDSNPVWSPRGSFISFERSVGDKKEIRIALPDGTPIQTIYQLLSAGGPELAFFVPGLSEETSYNAGITWSPDEYRMVFMSNGGEGNYDIYLEDLGGTVPLRLTHHKEKDGQADWSPATEQIVFVSGRSGNGDVYILDLKTRALTRLTGGDGEYLYPRWSPDGRRIAVMHGSNENHDILVIDDPAGPHEVRKALTTWPADDLRPVWSPDGRSIAFYSNYNAAGDPKVWSLFVVAADGSDPLSGDGLAAKVVASDIVPDVEAGAAWMPDSKRIVFVKNDPHEYNPLYVVDVKKRYACPVRTDTKMNHDVAVSAEGTIAFRAQVDQWDQIFIMKLRE